MSTHTIMRRSKSCAWRKQVNLRWPRKKPTELERRQQQNNCTRPQRTTRSAVNSVTCPSAHNAADRLPPRPRGSDLLALPQRHHPPATPSGYSHRLIPGFNLAHHAARPSGHPVLTRHLADVGVPCGQSPRAPDDRGGASSGLVPLSRQSSTTPPPDTTLSVPPEVSFINDRSSSLAPQLTCYGPATFTALASAMSVVQPKTLYTSQAEPPQNPLARAPPPPTLDFATEHGPLPAAPCQHLHTPLHVSCHLQSRTSAQ